MSQPAEKIVQFPGQGVAPGQEIREVRVADVDNGYTRLANELYDELIGSELTRNQAKVAHAVARKTFGFNKPSDRISDSQLAELTRLPRQKVNKAKNELIAMRVLVKDGQKIGINKVISEWKITCHYSGDSVTKLVTKNVTKLVTGVSPNQGHTKDTIQKTKDKNISSSEIANAITDAAHAEKPPAENKTATRPEAAVQTPNGQKWGSADDLKAAEWIYQKALITNPTTKSPNWAAWANDVRLMRQQDQRSHRDICELYGWVAKDAFWCANVLSPAKLREKWDQLQAQRLNQRPVSAKSNLTSAGLSKHGDFDKRVYEESGDLSWARD